MHCDNEKASRLGVTVKTEYVLLVFFHQFIANRKTGRVSISNLMFYAQSGKRKKGLRMLSLWVQGGVGGKVVGEVFIPVQGDPKTGRLVSSPPACRRS